MIKGETLTLSYIDQHPEKAVRVLEKLDWEVTTAFLDSLPVRYLVCVVEHMVPWYAMRYVETMEPARAAALIQYLPAYRGSGLLRCLSRERRREILSQFPVKLAAVLRRQLAYSEDTVGAWMDPLAPAIPLGCSIGEALEYARRLGRSLQNQLSAVRGENVYAGMVQLKRLVTVNRQLPLSDILEKNFKPLTDYSSLPNARTHSAWERFDVLPVIDREQRLVGILSSENMKKGLAEYSPSEGVDLSAAVLELAGTYSITLVSLVDWLGTHLTSLFDKQGRQNSHVR